MALNDRSASEYRTIIANARAGNRTVLRDIGDTVEIGGFAALWQHGLRGVVVESKDKNVVVRLTPWVKRHGPVIREVTVGKNDTDLLLY